MFTRSKVLTLNNLEILGFPPGKTKGAHVAQDAQRFLISTLTGELVDSQHATQTPCTPHGDGSTAGPETWHARKVFTRSKMLTLDNMEICGFPLRKAKDAQDVHRFLAD